MTDPTETLTIHDLAVDEHDLVRQVHATLLTDAFALDELVDVEELLDDQRAGLQTISVALLGARPVGVAVCNGDPDHPVELLSYLAVDATVRSRGIGAALLDHLARRWAASDLLLVVGEVHDPRFHATTATERPGDRLAFYARNGASLLELPWVQPAVATDRRPVTGMLLIVLHPRHLPPGASIPAAPVAAWVERQHDGDDAGHLQALRERLAGRDHLVVHQLAREVELAPLTRRSADADDVG